MNKKTILSAVVSCMATMELIHLAARKKYISPLLRRRLSMTEQPHVARYHQGTIENAYMDMRGFEPMLLVFDGQKFQAYSMVGSLSFRYTFIVPLLVHALRENHPLRFQLGQPVYQMVFTNADYLMTDCVNKPCPHTEDFPPIASFATAHRDSTIIPTAKAFPHPSYTQRCLYQYKIHGTAPCQWHAVDQNLQWEDLVPTIIWRGSDFQHFLDTYDEFSSSKFPGMNEVFSRDAMQHMTGTQIVDSLFKHYGQLTPRWRAATLTLRAKLQQPSPPYWIDTMFTGHINEELHNAFTEKDLEVSSSEKLDSISMSRYRYLLDLGGGGGTTWEGTLTKLRMPGVLFHHETPTKDWFYDLMEPWVHYIPVKASLSDLWERYIWAVEHPDEVQRIAQESTKLGEYLLSGTYMEQLYNDLYGSWLAGVVEAYQEPTELTWEQSMERYADRGIQLRLVSECNDVTCNTQWGEGHFVDAYPHATQAQ